MAERTHAQSATLARLTYDLHGTSIATTITPTGELIAGFRAIGHQFTFHINHRGRIVERSCNSHHFGVLSQPELRVLCTLAAREVAYEQASRHLDPESDGVDNARESAEHERRHVIWASPRSQPRLAHGAPAFNDRKAEPANESRLDHNRRD